MTRLEKAYELNSKEYENKEVIEREYCPYFLDVGSEDADDNTKVFNNNGDVIGCRDMSCKLCWNEEYI